MQKRFHCRNKIVVHYKLRKIWIRKISVHVPIPLWNSCCPIKKAQPALDSKAYTSCKSQKIDESPEMLFTGFLGRFKAILGEEENVCV